MNIKTASIITIIKKLIPMFQRYCSNEANLINYYNKFIKYENMN